MLRTRLTDDEYRERNDRCGTPEPQSGAPCLKPGVHNGPHAACLGYHPPPYDEYEWTEWSDPSEVS